MDFDFGDRLEASDVFGFLHSLPSCSKQGLCPQVPPGAPTAPRDLQTERSYSQFRKTVFFDNSVQARCSLKVVRSEENRTTGAACLTQAKK